MKTLTEAVLNASEVNPEDGKMSVKEAVLQEVRDAKCVRGAMGYRIISGRTTLGTGTTKDNAWENAILRILGFYRSPFKDMYCPNARVACDNKNCFNCKERKN